MNTKKTLNENYDSEAILFDDGYLVLSDNVSHLPSDLLLYREGIIIIGALNGIMQLDINGFRVRISAKEVLIVTPESNISKILYSQDFVGVSIIAKNELVRNLIDVNIDVQKRINYFSKQPVLPLDDIDFERYKNYNRQLKLTLQNVSRPYHRLVLYKIISALLYDLLGFIDEEMTCMTIENDKIRSSGDDKSVPSISAKRLYEGFIELLSQSPMKPRKVKYYADKLCVTSKYLCTVVKKISGRTPFDWINEYVMRDICHLLFTTNLSVKEISAKMDFPSLSFFGKYVKQHTGFSPTELRKQKDVVITP